MSSTFAPSTSSTPPPRYRPWRMWLDTMQVSLFLLFLNWNLVWLSHVTSKIRTMDLVAVDYVQLRLLLHY